MGAKVRGILVVVAVAWGSLFGGPFAWGEEWDETGVDWPVPAIPDVSEATPGVAKARSVARAAAREMGATEEQAEQAAFAVPVNLDEWKSPLQLAFEEHAGEEPTDGDPLAKKTRKVKPALVPKAASKAMASGKRVLGWHPSWATTNDI